MATAELPLARPAAPAAAGAPPRTMAAGLVGFGIFAVALYTAGAHGGVDYPWGMRVQAALGVLSALAVAGVLFGPLRLSAPRAGLAGWVLLALFAVWTGVTFAWSTAPDGTWAETNRALSYAEVAALGIVFGASHPRALRRAAVGLALFAVLVAGWALLGKLLPGVRVAGISLDSAGGIARLRAPLDYWNALALVCVMGLPPLLRFAVEGTPRVRSAGLAGAWLLVLVGTLTYSRGALLGLVAGVAVSIAVGGARLRTLLALALVSLAAAPAAAFGLAHHALRTNSVPLGRREDAGLLLLLVCAGALGLLLLAGAWVRRVEARTAPDPQRSRRIGRAMGALVAAGLLAAVATGAAGRAVHDFTHTGDRAVTDPGRLLSASGGVRWQWWRESLGAFSDRPVRGWGAGSFVVVDRLYRRRGIDVRQPHSVPLQFLAEEGAPGALLGMGAIVLLLAAALAALRSRTLADRERVAAAVLTAAAAAWAVHGLWDWDWDMPGVTVAALAVLGVVVGAAGAARAATGPADPPARERPVAGRVAALGFAVLLAAAACVSAVLPGLADSKANRALVLAGDGSQRALRRGLGEALYASRLDPAASAPLLAAALIRQRAGDPAGAQALELRAARRAPNDPDVWNALIGQELSVGYAAGALRAARHLLALEPTSPQAQERARQAGVAALEPSRSATAAGTPLPSVAP